MLKTSLAKIATFAAPLALMLAGSASAQGPGASVDWKLDQNGATVIFFDAPVNFDKHYRICIQDLPETGNLIVVLADRTVTLTRETCVDVVSNKISLTLRGSDETVIGLVYLVE